VQWSRWGVDGKEVVEEPDMPSVVYDQIIAYLAKTL
jgi:hypothetical protein